MYPKLPSNISKIDEDKNHFIITNDELNIINKIENKKNRLGFAILLKTYLYLGYSPQSKSDIPKRIISFIASQLNLDDLLFNDFELKSRTCTRYVSEVRKIAKIEAFGKRHYNQLSENLLEIASINPFKNKMISLIVNKWRKERIELPREKMLHRFINKAHKEYFDTLYNKIANSLTEATKVKIDNCLNLKNSDKSSFDWLKSASKGFKKDSILREIEKLKYLQSFNIKHDDFKILNESVIQYIKDILHSENAWQLKRHSKQMKYSIFAIFLYIMELEISDNLVKILLELIKRIENKTKKLMEKMAVKNIKRVYNKNKILRQLTLAIVENPNGTISETIFPKISYEIFQSLAKEYEDENASNYDKERIRIMIEKYKSSYRQLIKPILSILSFKKTNKKWTELEEGLILAKKYLSTKYVFYPEEEDIPTSLINETWNDMIISDGKVKKHNFELYVLGKLDKTIRCKEFWVENTKEFCNPANDLPSDWDENAKIYYDKLSIPMDALSFITPIKETMNESLKELNDEVKSYSVKNKKEINKNDVYIYQLGKKNHGYFHIPKIKPHKERPILKEIKKELLKKYGIVNLLDMLVEAERQTNFSKYFQPSTPKQVLKDDDKLKRLLINLFDLGTNIGLSRIHSAINTDCSYGDLRYFRKRYISPMALREAIRALVNKILKIRSYKIWGDATAVASDGKQFSSWDQNLLASSNPHYKKRGIMVYWHVERKSVCIFSQVKSSNSSEVAAMIRGLLHHATNMEIDKNYVDSRGQSEIAFAVSHFLGIDLLPRLKRIKHEKLYLADKNMRKDLPNLELVLTKPIRWDLIEKEYDEIVKHIVAIKEGIASPEVVLRRFTSYNDTHPTYKALIELGKAIKTIFLCRYLSSKNLREEIHEGLNVVESWNAANSFICYGKSMKISSNDPYTQELSVLALHLLQNVLILANTMMIDNTICKNGFLERLSDEDRKSISPLFTFNINPYGKLNMDLNKPSFLEAA